GMIFIVFDVEIIFMYPWATVFREIGLFGFVAILIFSFAVFESFVYVIGNCALEWGPRKKIERQEIVSPSRTIHSTIRRVGLEGRVTPEGEAA
ncbi:MAG: NADH-quinone oxidoreductase subunit A, partial [Actinomycetota bacterium]|nr:NADH-quinone oxidoreductase subunit A [Actinomycetota bacterium]